MTEDDRPLQHVPHDALATAAATDAPAEPAELAHLPLEEVTLVLLVSGRRRRPLKRWARRVRKDPDLSRCRVLVVRKGGSDPESDAEAEADLEDDLEDDLEAESEADPEDGDLLGPDPLADLDIVQLTETLEPDEGDVIEGYARIFASVTTPWFIVTSLPRRRLSTYKQKLKGHIAREIERVGEVGLSVDRPVMLYNRDRSKVAPRAHLHRELAELGPDPDRVYTDYLAFLALATGTARLEGVDLRSTDRELELFARVSLGRFNSHEQPPWSYRLVVASPSREVLSEQTAHLEQRLDNQGGRRWENVVGRLPVDEIPEGHHRLMIGVDTPFAALRTLQGLQPRAGVLAPARTVLLRGEGQRRAAVETRYLMHTVRGSDTWITLQRGLGGAARRRWGRSMVRKDARAILKGKGGKRMRLARLVRLATRPFYARREIWLIGERADTAQDNGFHLFRHLRESQPDREVYYIIDADSPQRSRVEHLGHVVDHSSASHRMLMMHASVLANAYSIKHMIPRQWTPSGYTRSLAWRVGAHRVYLKHGVHVSPTAVKRGTGGYDLYLSVNPMERDALRESSGYRDQVLETGMPRYDTLVPTPPSRTILFMPTWRRYLVPKLFGPGDEASVPYEGSTYERFITGLMHSPELHHILSRHDYRLQLLPHYNLRQEMDGFEFTSDRTEMADTTSNSFQDLIRGCDAFVTDYSSVHFDVAYLGTPIIYTHFDRTEYEDGHAVPSWFDHDADAFGPVASTLNETLTELDALLARGCTRDPAYQPRVDAAFTFHDHHNSERVVEEIDAMVDRARRGQ
ncbi:CDP-glycerol glycerophosphotransferase family protein [Janibacter sp. GS2]|uniref:CDP-glycerol glycerophosphotransferase family protein n=1 Tax=Janibacter sp. GS2 TaxID=3442646 RepID=UPI003EBC660C